MKRSFFRLDPSGCERTLALLLLFASPGAVTSDAQMTDTSWIYSDGYADSGYVYGTGMTQGSLSVHRYAVDVTVSSPLGRASTATQYSYQSGPVSNMATLSWSNDDFGSYLITSTHKVYCTIGFVYFVLGTTFASRTPPGQPCQSPNQATCIEWNDEAPIGARKQLTCKRMTHCCTAFDLTPVNGWCRTERCQKCSGQANDPVKSMCFQSQPNCSNPLISAFCLGLSCN